MSTFSDIQAATHNLSLGEVRELLNSLQERVRMEESQPRPKRIAGLHEGMTWVADDFDAPLPDEFWLGKDA